MWFPHMCDNSDAMRVIQCDFGISGYGVIYKLYERIFGFGYYTKWNDKICKIFAYEDCKLKSELVGNIVDACIEEGIFDANLFENYGILTSAEIQRMFYHVAKHRDDFEFDSRYKLIDISEKQLPVRNDKKKKDDKKSEGGNGKALFAAFCRCREIDEYINLVNTCDELKLWAASFEPEVIIFAMAVCVYKKRCNISYLNGILGNWKRYEYFCLDDVKDPLLSSPEFLEAHPEIKKMRKLDILDACKQ